MKPTNAQLRQFIATTFNDSELETFCFDYFPEVKYTRGMEFSYKVELLIGYCQRRDLEANLLANLQQERPQPFAAHFPAKVETPPVVETKLRNPSQIFLSHAHEDAELAQRLAHDLEAEGWPIWIAPDSIRPGEKWASAISRGLDESGIFVLLLTPHAVKSPWVRSETDVAMEIEHEGEMRLIPLLVEACRTPALWRAYQRIPFHGEYKTDLRALLVALVGEEPPSRSVQPLKEPERGGVVGVTSPVDVITVQQEVTPYQRLIEIIMQIPGMNNEPSIRFELLPQDLRESFLVRPNRSRFDAKMDLENIIDLAEVNNVLPKLFTNIKNELVRIEDIDEKRKLRKDLNDIAKSFLVPDRLTLECRRILRNKLTTYFSMDDLHMICFDLGVDFDLLVGNHRRTKVISLLEELERQQQVHYLLELCKAERPNIDWDC